MREGSSLQRISRASIQSKVTFISRYLVIYGLLFIMIAIMTATSYSKTFLSSQTIENALKSFQSTEVLLAVMGREMPPLLQEYEEEVPDLSTSKFVVDALTDIRLGDARSLLGREIPGLDAYHTEILIAGEGTDYTTLPYESPPPEDFFSSAEDKKDTPPEEDIVPEEASVLIYHTHTWEAFLPNLSGATKPNEAVSHDETKNIVNVGAMLKEELLKYNIQSQHVKDNVATELKERNWSYPDSYKASREIATEALAKNDKVEYIFDLHRDSVDKKITTTTINGQPYARLFFIVGKENKFYEENLRFVTELNKKLNQEYPGISRGVFQKSKAQGNGLYNQDLSEKALLIEIGGYANNNEEIKKTVEAFAKVFSEMYKGDMEVNAQ